MNTQSVTNLEAMISNLQSDISYLSEENRSQGVSDEVQIRQYLLHQKTYLNNWLSGERINAEQIDNGLRHCLDSLQHSEADQRGSSSADQLNAVCSEMNDLRMEKEAIFQQIDQLFDSDHDDITDRIETLSEYEALRRQVRALGDQYSDDILPKFGPLLQQFEEISSIRSSEMYARTEEARRSAEFAEKAGIWIYIFGTSLVVMRTILKDLAQNKNEAAPRERKLRNTSNRSRQYSRRIRRRFVRAK